MELYKEILRHTDDAKIVELACCQALRQIKEVLEDDAFSDPECFWRIERIVEIYESLGSGAETRHDFG